MRKRIATLAAGLALLGAPVAAEGKITTVKAEMNPVELKPYEQRYLDVRGRYVDEFGLGEAGRNIVRRGYQEDDGDVRHATRREVERSTERMRAALNPGAATAVAESATVEASSTPPTTASSSTAQCESGGDYSAVNPAGYYGAYQFDQQTWDAYAPDGYAGSNPASAPPAVQDAAAASVPYDAWPNC